MALSFADLDEEAQYFVATAQALRGVAFREEGEERLGGITRSSCASVKANAEPIINAHRGY